MNQFLGIPKGDKWPLTAFRVSKTRLRATVQRAGPGAFMGRIYDPVMKLLHRPGEGYTLEEIRSLAEALVTNDQESMAGMSLQRVVEQGDAYHFEIKSELSGGHLHSQTCKAVHRGHAALSIRNAMAAVAARTRLLNLLSAIEAMDEGIGESQEFGLGDDVLFLCPSNRAVMEGHVLEAGGGVGTAAELIVGNREWAENRWTVHRRDVVLLNPSLEG